MYWTVRQKVSFCSCPTMTKHNNTSKNTCGAVVFHCPAFYYSLCSRKAPIQKIFYVLTDFAHLFRFGIDLLVADEGCPHCREKDLRRTLCIFPSHRDIVHAAVKLSVRAQKLLIHLGTAAASGHFLLIASGFHAANSRSPQSLFRCLPAFTPADGLKDQFLLFKQAHRLALHFEKSGRVF